MFPKSFQTENSKIEICVRGCIHCSSSLHCISNLLYQQGKKLADSYEKNIIIFYLSDVLNFQCDVTITQTAGKNVTATSVGGEGVGAMKKIIKAAVSLNSPCWLIVTHKS